MKKSFKNYEDYYKWIMKNWKYQTTDLDQEIINKGFLIEIEHLGTTAFRLMYKSEFDKKLLNNFGGQVAEADA